MSDTRRVHVSLAELRTAASRALQGAGAPPGTERDGARATVWLESRGLRGAAALVRELPALAGGGGCRPPVIAGRRLDLANRPALVWSSTAVELAMLEPGAAILVEGCGTPRALLPEAAAHTSWGWGFALRSGPSEARVEAGGIVLDQSFASLGEADVLLVAAAHGPPSGDAGAGVAPSPERARIRGAELEARHAASLARGLRLTPGDWRAIREAAARILVPASDRSRSRGAGAEVDDNE